MSNKLSLKVLAPTMTFDGDIGQFHGAAIAGQFHGHLALTTDGTGTFRLGDSQNVSAIHVSRDEEGNLFLTFE